MTIFTPTRLKKNKTLGEVRTFAKLGPPGLVNQEVGDLKGPPWRMPHGETDPGMTQGWWKKHIGDLCGKPIHVWLPESISQYAFNPTTVASIPRNTPQESM